MEKHLLLTEMKIIMNNEEIVKIFVESVILRIPYEEMKRRKLAEKMQVEPKNPEIKSEKNKSNSNQY